MTARPSTKPTTTCPASIDNGCLVSLFSQQHYEMIEAFEKALRPGRLDKETKELWHRGNIYQDGRVNELFLAFRHGVSYGRAITE